MKPEINDNWIKLELDELIEVSKEKFDPRKNKWTRCVELEHISQGTGLLIGTVNSDEQKSIKNKFKKGDVLFGKLRPYLKKYWLAKFDGVCSTEIWVLKGRKISNNYLYYLIQTQKFTKISNISSGSKMPRADWNYMKEIFFEVPKLNSEQQKIAEILSTWDKAIELKEKLIDEKNEFKKGLMQKLLAEKVRFPEFTDDWTEYQLKDICKFMKGSGLSKDKLSINGDKKCILYGELYTTYSEVIQEIKSKTNIVEGVPSQKGDVLIPASTTTSGIDLANATALEENSVLLGGDINILRNDKSLFNSSFLAHYLTHIKKFDLASKAQGITIVHLYGEHLKKIRINIPPVKEQEKIAQVLSIQDDEIEILTEKLLQLKQQKKGLMQLLLTGIVRVEVN